MSDYSKIFQIFSIANNVLREAVRDKLLHVLVLSGFCILVFSLALGRMAVGGQERIIQSTGFWMLGIWGLAAVIHMGSNALKREIQQKTVYLILSRPINRTQFILGKYIGILIVLFLIYGMLSIGWLLLLLFMSIKITAMHFWALVFIFCEWMLLASLSILFASFTTPLLHNFFLIGITVLGHWCNDIRIFAENAKEIWTKKMLFFLYYILPNLESLNFRESALYGKTIVFPVLMQGFGVFLCWLCLFLFTASLIFENRKLL